MHSITGTIIRLADDARPAVAAAFAASTDHVDDRPEHGAELLRTCLPPQVLDALAEWRRRPTPWLTVTGLPAAGRLVPGPPDGPSDLLRLGLLRLLALSPAPDGDAGSAETVPHGPALHGLRNTEAVPAKLLLVQDVLTALPDSTVEALRRPEYAVGGPESYGEAVPMVWTLPDGGPGLRHTPDRVHGLTAAAQAALDAFETRTTGLDGTSVLIGARDLHVFDTRRALHRRGPLPPAASASGARAHHCYALRTAS